MNVQLILIYTLMAIIVFLIVFLIVRFVLQLLLLKECPHCGRTVSLAMGRECKHCGYVFLRNKYWKLNLAITILIMCVIGFIFIDVKVFNNKTDKFIENNEYLQEKYAVEETEESTETASDSSISDTTDTVEEESTESSGSISGVIKELFSAGN